MAKDDARIERIVEKVIDDQDLVSKSEIFDIAEGVVKRDAWVSAERLETVCISLLKVAGTACVLAVAVKVLIWLWHWCI